MSYEVPEEVISKAERLADEFVKYQRRLLAWMQAGNKMPQHVLDASVFIASGPMYGLVKNGMDLEAATKDLIVQLEILIGYAKTLAPVEERVGDTTANAMFASQHYQH